MVKLSLVFERVHYISALFENLASCNEEEIEYIIRMAFQVCMIVSSFFLSLRYIAVYMVAALRGKNERQTLVGCGHLAIFPQFPFIGFLKQFLCNSESKHGFLNINYDLIILI